MPESESTVKSCGDCIFSLSPSKQSELWKGTLSTPVPVTICGLGKGPLEPPPMLDEVSPAVVGRVKAADCGDFTEAIPEAGSDSVAGHLHDRGVTGGKVTPTKLFAPVPEAAAAEGDSLSAVVTSCLQCKNYVPAHEMEEAGLWPISACLAKGVAIDPAQVVQAAKDCPSRSFGLKGPRDLIKLELGKEFGKPVGGMKSFTEPRKIKAAAIDPTEYETDKEVLDEDRALGIRAWRRIPDPSGSELGGPVYLPIFDLEFFDADQRAAVPRTGDDEHPEDYYDHQGLVYTAAVLWMHLNETPAVWGEAGTGKTEFFRHLAWLMAAPFNRISVTASTEVEDLAGKMHFDPSRGTYFEYGRIPNAWMKPGVICLDEPNVGPPDVWQFIRPLTDNSKQLVLDMNNGERIPRHQHAFLGLAMNPAWDVRNSGTATLADADGSRLMHIFMSLPPVNVERQIITERCATDGWDIPSETLDTIMEIGAEIRSLCKNETLPITWGIRPQIKVARAARWFDLRKAYRLATADYLEPEQQAVIMDVIRAHSGRPERPLTRSAAVPAMSARFTRTPTIPTGSLKKPLPDWVS